MICPSCKSDLRGELIYKFFFEKYNGDKEKALETASFYGATETTGYFGREIALYDMERDMTTQYMCPDCGHVWNRF